MINLFFVAWLISGLLSCLFLIQNQRNSSFLMHDWNGGDWFLFAANLAFGCISLFIWAQIFCGWLFPEIKEQILKERTWR